jgi:hypothetical protein
MEKKCRVITKEEVFGKLRGTDLIQDFPLNDYKQEDGKVPTLKVKKASLDDQIQARELSSAYAVKFRALVKEIRSGNYPTEKKIKEVLSNPDRHEKTELQIAIFERCVVDPKFEYDEIVELNERHPELVNEVCAFALGIRPEVATNGS